MKPADDKQQGQEGLRQAMSWLHTWSGLIFGWALFAMFLTGTLAFFRPEITRWMQPEIQVRPAPRNRPWPRPSAISASTRSTPSAGSSRRRRTASR